MKREDQKYLTPIQPTKGTYVPPPNAVKPPKNWQCVRCKQFVANIDERCECKDSPVPLRPVWPNGRIENELTGKSAEDKIDNLLQEQSPCLFGSINVETGESYKGKTVDGKMVFEFDLWQSIKNKIRWWLFGNPHKPKTAKLKPKIEVVDVIIYFRRNRFTGRMVDEEEVSVYRTFEPDTNKTLEVWACKPVGGERQYFDVDVFEQTKRLVPII